MRNRTISLLLALVLTMSAILPLPSLAAGKEDPLVLATKSDYLSSTNYSYDADGRLACRFNAYCLFHYKYWYNGALKQETEESRSQGILCTKEYNQWGDLVKVTEYQSDGTTRTQIGEPEYDEYGRLTSYTLTGWYDKNGKLENTYDEESWVYIYDDVRHADSEPLTITFGTWEQDGNTRNGQEPIEWQVLESDGEYLTLISKYALERRVFHQKKTDITWGDSTLRSWLNTSFLERAFTPEEQLQLMKGATELGVSDKVFLLSTQEAARYLRKNADRICMPTDDARRQGLSVDKKTGSCSWLLRTPGNDKGTVVCVNADGSVNYQGVSVNSDKYGLRP